MLMMNKEVFKATKEFNMLYKSVLMSKVILTDPWCNKLPSGLQI